MDQPELVMRNHGITELSAPISLGCIVIREWPRYCRKVYWTKMVQNDLIPNWNLACERPKWTKMVHFGPFWPKEVHFGPFRSANRTLAIPELWHRDVFFGVASRWPRTPFWYRDLLFGIEILHSVAQHLDRLLARTTCACFLGSQHPVNWRSKKISMPKRSKNLEQKSSGEPPVETAPRNCRFLFLVVVELVLII